MLIILSGFTHKRDASSGLRIIGKEGKMIGSDDAPLVRESDHPKIGQNKNYHGINPCSAQ